MAGLLRNKRGDLEYSYRLALMGMVALAVLGIVFGVVSGLKEGLGRAANQTVKGAEAMGLQTAIHQVVQLCARDLENITGIGKVDEEELKEQLKICCDNACRAIYPGQSAERDACAAKCKSIAWFKTEEKKK